MGEVLIRVRGAGIAAVLRLLETGQLKFDVVSTKHHGPDLRKTALQKIADDETLRDALVYATSMGCSITFRHGHKIDVDLDTRTFVIGINADPSEIIHWVAGPEFRRNVLGQIRAFLIRIYEHFKKQRRAA